MVKEGSQPHNELEHFFVEVHIHFRSLEPLTVQLAKDVVWQEILAGELPPQCFWWHSSNVEHCWGSLAASGLTGVIRHNLHHFSHHYGEAHHGLIPRHGRRCHYVELITLLDLIINQYCN